MVTKMGKKQKLFELVLTAIFSSLIIVMTLIPNLGYISVSILEITTLHIVVILGATVLGWKYGAIIGGVWGLTSFLRAFTNPLWILFTNPLISVVPRIIVGLVAGLVFTALKKTKLPKLATGAIAAVAGTITNTVLVLSAIYIFGNMIESYRDVYDIVSAIYTTVIGVNGVVELVAAVIIVPTVYLALENVKRNYGYKD